MRGLSLVVVSGGHSSSRCAGPSLSRPLLLRSTGSRRTGSVAVAHGPSCPVACGILPDQGSNPCSLHWQADSQPLRHQGSPAGGFLTTAPPGKSSIELLTSWLLYFKTIDYICVGQFWTYILFHLYLCLSLYQYQTITVSVTV